MVGKTVSNPRRIIIDLRLFNNNICFLMQVITICMQSWIRLENCSWHWKWTCQVAFVFEVKKGFYWKWYKMTQKSFSKGSNIGWNRDQLDTFKNGDHPRTGLSIRGGTILAQFGSCWHSSFWEVFWLINCLHMLYFFIWLKH